MKSVINMKNEFIASHPLPVQKEEQRDEPSALAMEKVGRTKGVQVADYNQQQRPPPISPI